MVVSGPRDYVARLTQISILLLLLLVSQLQNSVARVSYYFSRVPGLYNTMLTDQPPTYVGDDSIQGITRKETRLERVRGHFPYWILPLISATVWFGQCSSFPLSQKIFVGRTGADLSIHSTVMLWAMMIFWLVQGRPKYPSMGDSQEIAFISDIGIESL